MHQSTAHLVTISTFFNELGTWSATTRTAGYTFTYSHFMHTNFHRLKQGKNQILLSPQLLWQQECSWTAHPSDLESHCPPTCTGLSITAGREGEFVKNWNGSFPAPLPTSAAKASFEQTESSQNLGGLAFVHRIRESQAANSIKCTLPGWRHEPSVVWICTFGSQENWHFKTWGLNHHVVTLLQL